MVTFGCCDFFILPRISEKSQFLYFQYVYIPITNMESASCSEPLLSLYQITRRHTPENCIRFIHISSVWGNKAGFSKIWKSPQNSTLQNGDVKEDR